MVTKAQIKQIHTILPDDLRKDSELKADFVFSYTEDESKTSTTQLTHMQAEEMIYFLKTGNRKSWRYFARFDKNNNRHMYILSLCRQIGWVTHLGSSIYADLDRLGSWIKKYGYKHKPLMMYTSSELSKLINQFEKVVIHAYK